MENKQEKKDKLFTPRIFAQPLICPKCKSLNDHKFKYCHCCGYVFKDEDK
ncbi:MAG: hypothetical protein SPK64_04290 [Candidatus Enterosoma sp.]|nr:hypothetical protein [Bacilli bacterium]MDD7607229.1 hypothetical protein [bacterium]MDY3907999.1 hypothetical protein [Candidatus Enterosoma sp.]MDY5650236.1 hypothetical protein [Candidatus Enterosoma sp.]MDY5866549.1 hypothetical protein [Candidatus Enterosoma sp.]